MVGARRPAAEPQAVGRHEVEPTQVVTLVKDAVVAISAAGAAVVAALGLRTWHREANWRQNRDVARALVRGCLQTRDAFSYARNPFVSAAEFPAGYSPAGESAQDRAKTESHVYQHREEVVRQALAELEAAVLEAEVFWGQRVRDLMVEVRRCRGRWVASVEAHLSNIASGHRDLSDDREFAKQVRSDVWASSAQKDELSAMISSSLDALIEFAQPHLRS
jgi:hypothetical protein